MNGRPLQNRRKRFSSLSAITLLEIIIVIAIMGSLYTLVANVLLPSLVDADVRMSSFMSDIGAAYDTSVMLRKPHRMVIEMRSGNYWIEAADREFFYLGSDLVDRDLSAEEEEDALLEFEDSFADYEELVGESNVKNEDGEIIPITSPVLKGKNNLKPVQWKKVENAEWGEKSLGPILMLQSAQSEHHRNLQDVDQLEDNARVLIHFFPQGYVEKTVLHIAFNDGEGRPDQAKTGYTIVTQPYEGLAEVFSGHIEVKVHEDRAQK